jgi:hypothetical protein
MFSLIAHTAKIIAKIFRKRIERKIEDVLGEDQLGEKMKRFSTYRGTVRTHFLHPGHRKIDLEEFA